VADNKAVTLGTFVPVALKVVATALEGRLVIPHETCRQLWSGWIWGISIIKLYSLPAIIIRAFLRIGRGRESGLVTIIDKSLVQ